MRPELAKEHRAGVRIRSYAKRSAYPYSVELHSESHSGERNAATKLVYFPSASASFVRELLFKSELGVPRLHTTTDLATSLAQPDQHYISE